MIGLDRRLDSKRILWESTVLTLKEALDIANAGRAPTINEIQELRDWATKCVFEDWSLWLNQGGHRFLGLHTELLNAALTLLGSRSNLLRYKWVTTKVEKETAT